MRSIPREDVPIVIADSGVEAGHAPDLLGRRVRVT
jgi:hypothetical protein